MSAIHAQAAPAPAPAPARARLGVAAAARHALALAWRNLLHVKTSQEELVGLSIQPVMFVLLFVYVFGGAIAGDSHRYLQYAIPGIMAQTLAFASSNTGVGLNNDISKGIMDRFRSLPIARSAVLTGQILGDLAKYAIAGVVIIGFGVVLGFRVTGGPLAALAALALGLGFGFAFCWVWCLIGLSVRTPQAVQTIGFTLLLPVTFASGAFVNPTSMPGWLQAFAKANPITLLAAASRGLMVGGPVTRPLLETLAWIVGIVALFAPLAVARYRRMS